MNDWRLRADYHNVNSVLVLLHGGIGDTVNATPFASVISDFFSRRGAKVYITLQSELERSILDLACITFEPLYLYSNRRRTPFPALRPLIRGRRLLSAVSLVPELRCKHIDLVIGKADIRYDYVSLYSKLIGAKYCIGELPIEYVDDKNFTGFPIRDLSVHCVHANAAILEYLGIVRNEHVPRLNTNTKSLQLARIKESVEIGRYACFHPGCGAYHAREKRWPINRFAQLADLVQKDLGAKVLFLGDSEESGLVAHIISQMKTDGAKNLAGELTLHECAALLADALFFVGNDSGLAHIAGAVGCPAFTIFLGTSSKRYCPYGQEARVVHGTIGVNSNKHNVSDFLSGVRPQFVTAERVFKKIVMNLTENISASEY
jgi:ADP-heptose:LPS heptosyltransferase